MAVVVKSCIKLYEFSMFAQISLVKFPMIFEIFIPTVIGPFAYPWCYSNNFKEKSTEAKFTINSLTKLYNIVIFSHQETFSLPC